MHSRSLLIIFFLFTLVCAFLLGIYSRWMAKHASIMVEWSTASELNTAGFNLYRSQARNSELIRVNQQIIPTSADAWTGGDYKYVDNQVQPGVTYSYWLEDVDLDGNTNRHGQIEIMAQAGGKVELWVAIFLSVLSIIGLSWLFVPLGANRGNSGNSG